MAFPASPTDGDTHTVRGIVHTYDDATKTWQRPVPTYVQKYNNARPPMFDGTVAYRDGNGSDIAAETVVKGPNGIYNLRSAVVLHHEFFDNGSHVLGEGYEAYKHVQIRISYRNTQSNPRIWFRLSEAGVGWVQKWNSLVGYLNWGTGGEAAENTKFQHWITLMHAFNGRDVPVQIDIIRPDLDLSSGDRCILVRSMYPRYNNDSVEAYHAQALASGFGKVHSSQIEVNDPTTQSSRGIATVVGWR